MHQFQNKSRFSILAEDLIERNSFSKGEKKQIYVQSENRTTNNLFKKVYNEKNYSRMSNTEYIKTKEREDFIQKESEMKRIEEARNEALSIKNFPDLILNKKSDHTPDAKNKTTFVNKIKPYILPVKKSHNICSDINKDNEIIETGWLKIFKDLETNKIIIKYGGDDYKEEQYKEKNLKIEKNLEIEEKEIIHNTMIALVNLHKRRTEEYIELWGKDDWERYFLFSNDDYNYNDSDDEYEDFDTEFENYDDYYDNEDIE